MIAIVIRTVILYIVVTLGIRLMGKRQIGDMQPNELVVTLLISEIAAIPLQDIEQPVLSGIAAIFTLVILEISVSILAMKSYMFRKLMSGRSVIIIKNGVIDQHAMRDVRMTVLDLVELLRGQNVFDVSTVAFAVLEVNGGLSVLLKSEEESVKIKDLKIKTENTTLPLPVISDGKIFKESLKALNKTEKDLQKLLKGTPIDKIFLMTIDRNGKANIIKRRI